MIGPPALGELVGVAGYTFCPGGEPSEEEVAPIRERLAIVLPAEATVLANREPFGRVATDAMLPGMERACAEWTPQLVLREPYEFSSAVIAHRAGRPTVQIAISLAEVESASITVAALALEQHRKGLVDELWASPYLTRFPASVDPSPFPTTVRYREPVASSAGPLPDWWRGSSAPSC